VGVVRPPWQKQKKTDARLMAAPRRRSDEARSCPHEVDPRDTLHLIDRGHVEMRVTTALGDVATLTVEGPGDHFG
jgi:CRP/FNR family cyclic AMP-dependent transcriptional regulator